MRDRHRPCPVNEFALPGHNFTQRLTKRFKTAHCTVTVILNTGIAGIHEILMIFKQGVIWYPYPVDDNNTRIHAPHLGVCIQLVNSSQNDTH